MRSAFSECASTEVRLLRIPETSVRASITSRSVTPKPARPTEEADEPPQSYSWISTSRRAVGGAVVSFWYTRTRLARYPDRWSALSAGARDSCTFCARQASAARPKQARMRTPNRRELEAVPWVCRLCAAVLISGLGSSGGVMPGGSSRVIRWHRADTAPHLAADVLSLCG